MAGGGQVIEDGLLEFVSGVVGTEVNAHGGNPTFLRHDRRRHCQTFIDSKQMRALDAATFSLLDTDEFTALSI
ncbi:hypothetical protein MTOK_60490 [Mycolicibacterium tokaiense]|nr:hypothetical protein MTOK_60490 [Mycolicibacterium tokaiense]